MSAESSRGSPGRLLLGSVLAEADRVGHGALDQHRVVVVGRVVVVAGVEVVAEKVCDDALVVGVLDAFSAKAEWNSPPSAPSTTSTPLSAA